MITENRLDNWVRGNQVEASTTIPSLLMKLLSASLPDADKRVPGGDSIWQPGSDGTIDSRFGFPPYLPSGKVVFEIGIGDNPRDKATSDYADATKDIPKEERLETTFVFITPLSARKVWAFTWKQENQLSWLKKRRLKKEWKDLKIIDSTVLCEWIKRFPSIEKWLLRKMEMEIGTFDTVDETWDITKSFGDPPPLKPDLFLSNRDRACELIEGIFSRTINSLRIETKFPDQAVDVTIASILNRDKAAKEEITSRTLVAHEGINWELICDLADSHIFVLDYYLEEISNHTQMIQRAISRGHRIIYPALPGGCSHPNSIALKNPLPYQIKEILQKCGYEEERARLVAEKTQGNLSSLKRLLQSASMHIEWNDATYSSLPLALASFIGGWEDRVDDQEAIENYLGKGYGEWVNELTPFLNIKLTPLRKRNRSWKITPRSDAWNAFAKNILPNHVELFENLAIKVLSEIDPKFDLPQEEWSFSGLNGVQIKYSNHLRDSICESLAILGANESALIHCSKSHIQQCIRRIIGELLSNDDWRFWATIIPFLPKLIESDPISVIKSISQKIDSNAEIFKKLFSLESPGFGGGNYLTGIYWALENAAWNEAFLLDTLECLVKLHAIDPGGNYVNRPGNSFCMILLPWMPQTTASVEKRISVLKTLLNDHVNATWGLALSLLPSHHQISHNTHRPTWREWIPQDFKPEATNDQYLRCIESIYEAVFGIADGDFNKTLKLFDLYKQLWPKQQEMICTRIVEFAPSLEEISKQDIIDKINKYIRDGEKYGHLNQDSLALLRVTLQRIDVKDKVLLYRHLFSGRDFELYEVSGDWKKQSEVLDTKRSRSIEELLEIGIEDIVRLLESGGKPELVGKALATHGDNELDIKILNEWLTDERPQVKSASLAYLQCRFYASGKYAWLDSLDVSALDDDIKCSIYSLLPFSEETWHRVSNNTNDATIYWKSCNLFGDENTDIRKGIENLSSRGFYDRAASCFSYYSYSKQICLDEKIWIADILAKGVASSQYDQYFIGELLKSIRVSIPIDDLMLEKVAELEFNFLPYIDRDYNQPPLILEKMVVTNPEIFIEFIEMIYRSTKTDQDTPVTSDEKRRANYVYHFFDNITSVPGYDYSGAFDAEAFHKWIREVESIANTKGYIEVASSKIGRILFYSKPDPDGLWINATIAKYLNEHKNQRHRDGFRTQCFNSRGVHSFTKGKEEREISESYRKKAIELEEFGLSRLSKTLFDLAESYLKESIEESERNIYGDDSE